MSSGGSAAVAEPKAPSLLQVALLTGGFDKHYTFGLAMALAKRVCVEIIGGDGINHQEYDTSSHIRFLNLRGSKAPGVAPAKKVWRLLAYYARLLRYAATAKPTLLHILWNNKFETFDRTVLMLYYKLLGKKIVLTAHNVNQKARDGRDSLLNRLTLRAQYRLADRIFTHTEKMKDELCAEFGLPEAAVALIPYGINNAVPRTMLSRAEARQMLGIGDAERVVLFFGNIRPSKGLEYLVAAFQQLAAKDRCYRLIIAGARKSGGEDYVDSIRAEIRESGLEERVIERIEYIPDEDIEVYFKAADVLALPYTDIFQSGILSLGLSFGLPVVATDVGSLRDFVIEGETGFLCRPRDSSALAEAIEKYFASDLFESLNSRRDGIAERARRAQSWEIVADTTVKIYADLLEGHS